MKIVVTYTFILISLLNYAQNNKMNATRKDLETKSKAALVENALQIIKEKHPAFEINKEDYIISAFKNSKDVIVKLDRIVRFISEQDKNTKISYDIEVNLVSKQSIPFDDSFFGKLYKPSEYDLKAIAFVKKHFGNFSPEFIHTITETENEYTIESANDTSYGIYTLIKKTGEIIEPLETSYLPAPKPNFPEEDPLIEIF